MTTFPFYDTLSHSTTYDFDKTSDSITKFYDEVRELVNWAARMKRWVAKALFMPIAFVIIMVGAIVFAVPSLVVLLMLKAGNRKLAKSVRKESLELKTGHSYMEVRDHLEDTVVRLEKIKSMYALLQTKHNIILRVQFLREVEQSINLIQACVDGYTKALETYDKPLLSGFENIVVKEKDLWGNRTQAYEYML